MASPTPSRAPPPSLRGAGVPPVRTRNNRDLRAVRIGSSPLAASDTRESFHADTKWSTNLLCRVRFRFETWSSCSGDPRQRARARRQGGVGVVPRRGVPRADVPRAAASRTCASARTIPTSTIWATASRDAPDARRAPDPGLLEDRRLRQDQALAVRPLRPRRRRELVRLPVRLAARQPRGRPGPGRAGAGLAGRYRDRPGKQDAKLVLVGHSMGGLVARHFLEVLDGWERDQGAADLRHAVPGIPQRPRLPGQRLPRGHRTVQGRPVGPAALVDLRVPAAADLRLRRRGLGAGHDRRRQPPPAERRCRPRRRRRPVPWRHRVRRRAQRRVRPVPHHAGRRDLPADEAVRSGERRRRRRAADGPRR